MTAVAVVTWGQLARPWLAVALVGLALGVTVYLTIRLRADYRHLLAPGAVIAELTCGVGVVVGDGWAYRAGHVFGPSQTLGVIWPLSGVLAAGVASGAVASAAAGAVFGPARWADALANGVRDFNGARALSMVSTALVYASAGAVVAYITRLLRQAREEVAVAQAREEVARHLHDGVLQALAVIERRTDDTAIARIAREQERELRDFLFSASHNVGPARDLGVALRAAVGRFERDFDVRAELLMADDLPELRDEVAAALVGAVGEALTNAGKHGHPGRVTVYLEPQDAGGVFCSVRDDGKGFELGLVPEGVGLARSVRGRISETGGRVEIKSRMGEGTEVCMWVG
jgi:signal transduction histidine kinase